MSLNRFLRLAPVWYFAFCLFCVPIAAQSTPPDAELSAARDAIFELKPEKLKPLLDKNPTLVKQRDTEQEEETLLHYAVRRQFQQGMSLSDQESTALVEIIKLLIDRKSNVNARDNKNRTPLGYAVRWYRNIEAAKVLLANGADMNAKLPGLGDDWVGTGGTALHIAVAAVNFDVVKFLIESKANVNAKDGAGNTPLIINAVTSGHTYQPDIAKVLLAAGAAVNTQNIHGETALLEAAGESAEVVRVLLANGADPNLKNERGVSPAQVAIGTLDGPEIVALLIKYKADLNIKDEEGRTLLHKASSTHDTDTAEMLIVNGSDIDAKDKDGYTPLIMAVLDDEAFSRSTEGVRVDRGGNEDIVELLLKSGANVNLPDGGGETALHHAARKDRRVVLRMLLENKGDPNHKNNEGGTPLQPAIGVGSLRGAELLIKKGANPNIVDNKGQTPLHTAVLYDQPALVKLLLANRVDTSIKDKEGKTALDWAKLYGKEEAAALLSVK